MADMAHLIEPVIPALRRYADGVIKGQRLYQLVRLTGDVTDHTFETRFLGSGATADSFTFG
jgi:hypothetical protein